MARSRAARAGTALAEMAIATTAFLFGHALWIDKGSLARRLARLVPYLLVVAVWQAVYSAAGYGVIASVVTSTRSTSHSRMPRSCSSARPFSCSGSSPRSWPTYGSSIRLQ